MDNGEMVMKKAPFDKSKEALHILFINSVDLSLSLICGTGISTFIPMNDMGC